MLLDMVMGRTTICTKLSTGFSFDFIKINKNLLCRGLSPRLLVNTKCQLKDIYSNWFKVYLTFITPTLIFAIISCNFIGKSVPTLSDYVCGLGKFSNWLWIQRDSRVSLTSVRRSQGISLHGIQRYKIVDKSSPISTNRLFNKILKHQCKLDYNYVLKYCDICSWQICPYSWERESVQ